MVDPLAPLFKPNYPKPEGSDICPSGFPGSLAHESTVDIRSKESKNEPAATYDAGKLRFDLIPPEWEEALAKVMGAGAVKYADRNWEKGLSWSRRYGSMRRHMNAFWAGEDFDKETGLPHLAHAAWNALALLTFMTTHPEFDNRVKGGKQ